MSHLKSIKPATPTIVTTMGVLVKAEASLNKLADVRLPAKPGYHLAKLLTLVRGEIAHFTAARAKLVKEMGTERPSTPDELPTMGPTVLQVPPDKFAEYAAACDDLAAVDVTIPWGPFDLNALNGDAVLTANDQDLLGPLITCSED